MFERGEVLLDVCGVEEVLRERRERRGDVVRGGDRGEERAEGGDDAAVERGCVGDGRAEQRDERGKLPRGRERRDARDVDGVHRRLLRNELDVRQTRRRRAEHRHHHERLGRAHRPHGVGEEPLGRLRGDERRVQEKLVSADRTDALKRGGRDGGWPEHRDGQEPRVVQQWLRMWGWLPRMWGDPCFASFTLVSAMSDDA